MPYTLELHFDKETDQKIREIWHALARDCNETYMQQSGFPPHLTLALYSDELDAKSFETIAKKYQNTFISIPITFSNIGLFKSDNDVSFCLTPCISNQLIELHTQLHLDLASFSTAALSSHYNTGSWTPHCTLTMQTPLSNVGVCAEYMLRYALPINGILEKVHIEHFEF